METNKNIEELQEYLRQMEEKAREYYERRIGTKRDKKPKGGIVNFIKDPVAEKEKVHKNKIEKREKREKMKKQLISQNELYHFGPARTAIVLTKAGLNAYEEGEIHKAVFKLEEALGNFPNNHDLQLNLGKLYLETGINVAEGLAMLLQFYLVTENKYYIEELISAFNIVQDDKRGKLTGSIGNENGIDFIIEENMLEYNEIPEGFTCLINIPYRIPLSLEMERRDKEEVKMKDYHFLKKWITSEKNTYEVVINKGSFRPFITEFYGTILELAGNEQIEKLTSFNKLHLEQVEYENYYQGQFTESKEDYFGNLQDQLVSVISVNIPENSKTEFIEMFFAFARRHLISEMSDEEIDLLEDEIERAKQEELDAMIEYEIEEKSRDDYNFFTEQSKIYGQAAVILENLLNNVPKPYDTKNESLFVEKKQYYMNIFEDIFDRSSTDSKHTDRKVTVSSRQKNYGSSEMPPQILELVKSNKIKDLLSDYFEDIEEILEKRAHMTMMPMRQSLEVILQESSLKFGLDLINEKGYKKSLYDLMCETQKKHQYQSEIKYEMLHIKNMANSALHYDALKEYYKITEEEAKELFAKLLKVVRYFVIKFEL